MPHGNSHSTIISSLWGTPISHPKLLTELCLAIWHLVILDLDLLNSERRKWNISQIAPAVDIPVRTNRTQSLKTYKPASYPSCVDASFRLIPKMTRYGLMVLFHSTLWHVRIKDSWVGLLPGAILSSSLPRITSAWAIPMPMPRTWKCNGNFDWWALLEKIAQWLEVSQKADAGSVITDISFLWRV
jgi:hypothetical protein